MKQSLVGITAVALAAAGHAQTTQTTVVRAPIAAVAIGPSHASVDVNVNNGVRADPNLTHPADPILTRGWALAV